MHRAASKPYGPTVGDMLKGLEREQNLASSLPASLEDDAGAPGMQMALRRKRQSAILKGLLKEGGYGDLAKMIAIHKEEF